MGWDMLSRRGCVRSTRVDAHVSRQQLCRALPAWASWQGCVGTPALRSTEPGPVSCAPGLAQAGEPGLVLRCPGGTVAILVLQEGQRGSGRGAAPVWHLVGLGPCPEQPRLGMSPCSGSGNGCMQEWGQEAPGGWVGSSPPAAPCSSPPCPTDAEHAPSPEALSGRRMESRRLDMELLSNSMAAYAHIRGEPAQNWQGHVPGTPGPPRAPQEPWARPLSPLLSPQPTPRASGSTSCWASASGWC